MESNETRKLKAYISGAMTGLPNKNEERFNEVERVVSDLGYTVINPIKLGQMYDWSHSQFMRRDINELLLCDIVVLFDNWINSKGARAEAIVAASVGIPVIGLCKDNTLMPIALTQEDIEHRIATRFI